MVPRGTSPSACAGRAAESPSVYLSTASNIAQEGRNGTFRQNEGQFLVPLRTWGPQRLSYGVPSGLPGRASGQP